MHLPRAALLIPVLALLLAEAAAGQEHPHHTPPSALASWALGAQAIGLLTHAAPAIDGRSLTEGYLTQPNLMAHVGLWNERVALTGTLNLEAFTLRRGELNAGIWGEGYVDRRHPHTLLHEAVGSVRLPAGPAEVSAAFGKGFAPFGTDDPMVRPFVKYPINHHLAQLLERLVGIAALRRGPVLLEVGIFNGDEPSDPGDFATVGRFGDSWSARATTLPMPGLELQASYAAVESPEIVTGGGLNSRKRSASARWERWTDAGQRSYALLEWARTDEYEDADRYYSFRSVLAEAAVRRWGVELAVRWERTERPEEERLADPFRSPRPHSDFHLLGITRWNLWTLGVGKRLGPHRSVGAVPFAEVGYARPTSAVPSVLFDPAEFYGGRGMWSFSAGVRLEVGAVHRRMGRYGAAALH